MLRRIFASVGAFTMLLIALLTAAVPVSAQSSPGGNGMRITPVRSDLTIKPGDSGFVNVTITNVTSTTATFKAIINDFSAGTDESGDPRVYLDPNSSAPSHGLKSYVQPIGDVTLKPQESREIKATIKMPSNTAGGGYYGVIRFIPTSADNKDSVSLSGSVGTLVLVTVPGNIVEQASLSSFNVARMSGEQLGKASSFFTNGGKDAQGKGVQAVLRVQNSGNVQLAPFGKIILKKGSKVVASYELNTAVPKSVVLPDSTRRFQIDLGDKPSGFGRYTLEGNFGYGSSGQLLSASTSFFVVPMPYLIAAVIVALLIITAAVVFPRMLKSHDRKLLRKVRRNGKK